MSSFSISLSAFRTYPPVSVYVRFSSLDSFLCLYILSSVQFWATPLKSYLETVIFAFPIWLAFQLSIRDRLNSSFLEFLSYPIRFSLSIGTFGFSAEWILFFPLFSLLMSTFSLLIALSYTPCCVDLKSLRLLFSLYRTFYYHSPFLFRFLGIHRFGF